MRLYKLLPLQHLCRPKSLPSPHRCGRATTGGCSTLCGCRGQQERLSAACGSGATLAMVVTGQRAKCWQSQYRSATDVRASPRCKKCGGDAPSCCRLYASSCTCATYRYVVVLGGRHGAAYASRAQTVNQPTARTAGAGGTSFRSRVTAFAFGLRYAYSSCASRCSQQSAIRPVLNSFPLRAPAPKDTWGILTHARHPPHSSLSLHARHS